MGTLVVLVKLIRRITATRRDGHRGYSPGAGSTGSAGGGGFFVQYWVGHYHGPNLSLISFGLLALTLSGGVLAVQLLGLIVPRCRSALRRRRHERRRRLAAANIERRTRALMSELCPQGWRAQITLFGPGDDVPTDLPGGRPALVALDWAELEDEKSRRVAVVRRVWAPTIGEALEAMVADRCTDEALEQIERGAMADGALWPDLYL